MGLSKSFSLFFLCFFLSLPFLLSLLSPFPFSFTQSWTLFSESLFLLSPPLHSFTKKEGRKKKDVKSSVTLLPFELFESHPFHHFTNFSSFPIFSSLPLSHPFLPPNFFLILSSFFSSKLFFFALFSGLHPKSPDGDDLYRERKTARERRERERVRGRKERSSDS